MMFRQGENLVLDAENLEGIFKPSSRSLMQVCVFPGESQVPGLDFTNQGQYLDVVVMDFQANTAR